MKTLTPKQQRLVEENQKLVYEVAKRYIGHHDFENIQASGFLGLCQAAAHYDSAQRVQFSTYAWKCIAREVNKASDRELLRDEYTVRLPESDVLRHEVVSAHTASAVEALLAEDSKRLRTIFRRACTAVGLTEIQRKDFETLRRNGFSQRAAAAKRGKSQSALNESVARAEKKLERARLSVRLSPKLSASVVTDQQFWLYRNETAGGSYRPKFEDQILKKIDQQRGVGGYRNA